MPASSLGLHSGGDALAPQADAPGVSS